MTYPKTVMHVLNGAAGGAALSTLALVERLAAADIRSCAVCHDAGSDSERQRLREAMSGAVCFTSLYWWNRKIRMARWKRPLSELKQIWHTGWSLGSSARVAACASRWNVDLIHTNTILTPEGGFAARRLGLPHVWHLRELLGPGHPFRLRREGAAFGRTMSRYCSKIVANSPASAATIRDWVPQDMLEVVPNGIDIAAFQPKAEPALGRLVVAMVGNLSSRWKKHALFVDAAALVDPSLPIDWRFYGHDPSHGGKTPGDSYVDALHQRLAEKKMANRFTWPGFIEEPSQIMSQIDILVHPADGESFGRVAVEAMAASLPVIGVRGGGVGEIVVDGQTGLLAEKDDAKGLAQCIERLVRDADLRRKFGQAGRQRAVDEYALEACARGIMRVYASAMERPLGQTASRDPLAIPTSSVAQAS